MRNTAIEAQINQLNRNIDQFAACIQALPEGAFLQKIDEWSPRDVLAHLIGWNRHIITGAEQIRKGKLPFYFIDPGDDFSKVNAELVRTYASQNKQNLLDELETSQHELIQFLGTLDPEEWTGDYGLRYQDAVMTIQHTVDALSDDYVHHRAQIAAWVGQ